MKKDVTETIVPFPEVNAVPFPEATLQLRQKALQECIAACQACLSNPQGMTDWCWASVRVCLEACKACLERPLGSACMVCFEECQECASACRGVESDVCRACAVACVACAESCR